MDLTVAKSVQGHDSANTVYLKLLSLTSCIKDKKAKKSFYIHHLKIKKFLKDHVNENNKHIFNDLFISYLIIYSHNPRNNKNKEPYEIVFDLINRVCSNNINEAIYCYSEFMSYYTRNNRPYIYPNNDIFYDDDHLSYYEIFLKLMDIDNKSFFINYEAYRKIIIKNFERYPDYYDVGSSALCIAASYCIINNNYEKFDDMVHYILDNVVNIYDKMEMNGLIDNTRYLPIVGNHIDVVKYIDFMMRIITNSNENNKAIH